MRNTVFATILIAISFLLSSCESSGSSSNNNTLPSFLTLAAPSSYPVQSVPVTAYLNITNNATTAVSGLSFAIANNTTGVTVAVASGSSNPCYNIAASANCVFPVTIGANSKPGSFSVNITPPSSSKITRIGNSIKSALGMSPSSNLSATIGMIDVTATSLSGANGITFLAASTIAANIYGNTQQIITAVVNSPNAGSFNTINLTDAAGNLLHFTPLSGNSGAGVSDLSQNAIVTLRLTIPHGVTSLTYYAQTAENKATVNNNQSNVKATTHNLIVVSQGTIPYTTTTKPASGILNISPSSFNLNGSHDSQILNYSNSGNSIVTNLNITPSSPLTKISSTCGTTLTSGTNCTYTVKFDATAPGSGNANVTATYNSGDASASTIAQATYNGASAESGLTISSGDNPNFNFTSQTGTPSNSAQITISNTGSSTENNISFSVPAHFSLGNGSSNSCDLNGNNINNSLNPSGTTGSSCNLTLTYTNNTVTAATTADLVVNYVYSSGTTSGNSSSTVTLSYSTVQSSAALNITPSSQVFTTIANNNLESSSYSFTIFNASSDTIATGITPLLTGNDAALFSILQNDCGSSIPVGGSCIITIEFGPTTTVSGNKVAQLQVVYVPYSSAIVLSSTANLSGNVRLSNSANVTASFSANGFAVGSGPGDSVNDSYQVETNQNASLNVVYTNSGTDVANNFTTTANISSPWSLSSHGCNNANLATKGGTCTDTYMINSSSSGQNNFSYTNITASFTDESGSVTNQEIIPTSGNSTYVNIYASPYVTANLSSSTSGMPQIESSEINTTSYLVYNLFGGYQVASGNYAATSAVTSGHGGTLSIGSSCTLSSTITSCNVSVNSGTLTSGASTYTLTPTGTLTPIPSPNPITLTVYTPAIVNAYLSSESSTLNQINEVTADSTFYLYYILSGGYPGGTFTYVPTLPSGMTISGTPSCTLIAGATFTCVITINAGINLGSGTIDFGASSGGVVPTPSSSNMTVNPQNVYFGTSAGTVYKNGTLLPGGGSMLMPDGGGITSIAASDGHVYAGTSYVYDNNGNEASNVWVNIGYSSWSQIGAGTIPINNGHVTAVTVSGDTVYAGILNYESSPPNGSVWASSGGSAWSKIGNYSFIYPVSSIIESGGIVYVAVSSTEGNAPIGNIYSLSAETWNLFGTGVNTAERIKSITILGDTVYKGTQIGNVWSSSGGDWVNLNNLHTLDGSTVNSIVAANNTIYAGTSNGFVWESSTDTWESICGGQIPNGGDYGVSSIIASGSDIYASTYNNDVWLCDGGSSWALESGSYLGGSLDNGNSGQGSTYLAVADNNIYAGTSVGNVWKKPASDNVWGGAVLGSLDNSKINSVAICGNNICAGTAAGNIWTWSGTNWIQLPGNGYSMSLDGTSSAYSPVNSIATLGSNIYAGTESGNVWLWSGSNWTLFGSASRDFDNSSVHSVAVSGGDIYAGTFNGYVYNWSGSWGVVGGNNVPDANVTSVAVSGTNVYASSSIGNVFISTNNGSWLNLGNLSGLSSANGTYIYSLAISGNNLYAGGTGSSGCGYVWLWSGGPNWMVESGSSGECSRNGSLDGFPVQPIAISNIGTIYAGTFNQLGFGGGNLWELESSTWVNTGYNGNPASFSVNAIITGP